MRRRVLIVAYPASERCDGRRAAAPASEPVELARRDSSGGRPWAEEPRPFGVADGIPARMDRLRSLGNALVPQVAEWLGQRILAYEA
jgi:DNA (cytosine-5)-methyltransferase 1